MTKLNAIFGAIPLKINIMKNTFTLLILLTALSAFSQKLYPLKVEDDLFAFKIKVLNHQLVLEQQSESTLFNAKKDFPAVEKVTLEAGDLVIHYKAKNGSDLLSYSFSLSLLMPDGTGLDASPTELSDNVDVEGGRTLRWLDATELMGNFDVAYTLKVTRSLMGAVNCEGLRPVIKSQTKVISYVGASVGLMSIVVGQIYRAEKESNYNRYQQLWADGAPDPGTENNPLDNARKNDVNAKVFTWGGAGLVVASALFYKIKADKVRKKQKHYDKFCGQGSDTSFKITPSKTGVGFVLNF